MKKSLFIYLKNFFLNNQSEITSLFYIFLLLWLIFNAIPSLFLSLFYTFVGNILLIVGVFLVSLAFSISIGFVVAIILIILYQISHPLPFYKESFWTPESADTFLRIQTTINRNKNFDLSVIQKQASQQEVDYFNKHGKWPWSQATKDLYISATNKNTYIRSYPPDSLIQAQTVYNENAIKQILSSKIFDRGIIWIPSTPDLSGFGTFALPSGLKTKITNPESIVIRKNPKTGGYDKINFLGYGGILGEQVRHITPLSLG